jgi:hypothetical protein
MRRTPTQTTRVYRALLAAGARGVRQQDFLPPEVTDGGRPIARLASRIAELRAAGHAIDTVRAPSGIAVYVLRRPPHERGSGR